MENTENKDKKFNKKKSLLIVAIALVVLIIAGSIVLIVYMCKRVKYDEDASDFVMAKGCSDFYYNCLSENQQKMYRMIYRQAENLLYSDDNKTTLGVYNYFDYGLNKSDAVDVWYAFRYDALAMFLVSNTYFDGPNEIEIYVAPEFAKKENREIALKALESAVAEVGKILEGVDDSAAKFKVIYDYVMDHTEYKSDENGQDVFDGYSYSILGPLDGDESTDSICQGYAKAVAYLCNIFGVECIYVGSGNKNHALNVVKINNLWYYADSTSDDKGNGAYGYFLKCKDDYWRDICRASDNKSQDRLIAKVPQLTDKEFDYILKDKNLSYSILSRNKCSVADCDTNATQVIVPSKFVGMDVIGIDDRAFAYCDKIVSIEIADSIASIGNGAFYRCSSLTGVEIPKSVTSVNNSVFEGCSSLSQVVFHDNVKRIGNNAFNSCSSLKNIDLPMELETLGASAFSQCNSLESIEIPSAVRNIYSETFAGCSKLSRVVLPSGLISIGAKAFFGCSSLTGIELSNRVSIIEEGAFEDSGLVSFKVPQSMAKIDASVFAYCYNLKTVEFGEDSQISSIGDYAFISCNELTSIEIPSGVTSLGNYAFMDCSNIKSINLSNVTISIGERAFLNCIELTSVEMPSALTSLGQSAFSNCKNLTGVVIPIGLTSIDDNAFSGCSRLASVDMQEGITSIGANAFASCESLTSVNLPSGVTSIGSFAFDRCISLTSVWIPASVTSASEGLFYGCNILIIYCEALSQPSEWSNDWNLWNRPVVWGCQSPDIVGEGLTWYESNGEITISGCYGEPTEIEIPDTIEGLEVTGISSNAFYNKKNLTSIKIPATVTRVGDDAFRGCDNLTKVTMPTAVIPYIYSKSKDNLEELTINGGDKIEEGQFMSVKRLVKVVINNLESIERRAFMMASIVDVEINNVKIIGASAFDSCSKLESVTFGYDCKVESIAEKAFWQCRSLMSLRLPKEVTEIGNSAFADCINLTSIEMPKIMTSIGDYAFYNCEKLTEIVLPSGLISIGSNAFAGCRKLTSIIIPISVTYIGERVFYECTGLEVYCEAESKPEGWDDDWDVYFTYNSTDYRRPVQWGYKGR